MGRAEGAGWWAGTAARAGGLGRVVLAGGLSFGSGCFGGGREEAVEHIREAAPIARVEVELDGGSVTIDGSGQPGVDGAVTFRWSDVAPEVIHYVQDEVLHILGRCDPYGGPCLLDVELRVPTAAAVNISTYDGDVRVAGVTGDVEVGVEVGSFEGHALGGSVYVESAEGRIVADGLGGPYVDARTGDGTVDLLFVERPSRVVARSGDGDVTVVVPAGPYRVDADAPRGEVDVGPAITSDPAADAAIVADTERGDVRIWAAEK